MTACEREFAASDFHKLCYLHAPRLQLGRHANLESIWVSRDREIMALVGNVRFVGKVFGLFGLPFMKHEGVYLCSTMSDCMLLETMRVLCTTTESATRSTSQDEGPAEVHASRI